MRQRIEDKERERKKEIERERKREKERKKEREKEKEWREGDRVGIKEQRNRVWKVQIRHGRNEMTQ